MITVIIMAIFAFIIIFCQAQLMKEIIYIRANIEYITEETMKKTAKEVAEYMYDNKEKFKNLIESWRKKNER